MSRIVKKLDEFVVLAEAITSNGESVIVSTGKAGMIGRTCDDEHPETEFHLLDVRYKFPFWSMSFYSGVGTAIDEDGEVWLLCSHPSTHFHKMDPEWAKEEQEDQDEGQKRPFRTNLMSKKGERAVEVFAGCKMLAVKLKAKGENGDDGDKENLRIKVFTAPIGKDSNKVKFDRDRKQVQKLLDEHYNEYLDQFELIKEYVPTASATNNGYMVGLYVKQRKSEELRFPPLKVEI